MHRMFFLVAAIFCAGTVSAQDNLVQNGNFTDSTGAHWTLETNGVQAKGSVDVGRYAIDVEAGNINSSGPQLIQRGILLTASEGYVLSFKASASDSGNLRVSVVGDDNSVYTDSAKGLMLVSSTLKGYSTVFFVPRSSGNARVIFNCAVSSTKIRYSLDSISLVKSAVPMIRINQPVSGTRWISDSERQIVWQNSGILDKVVIRFSSDNGKNWADIAPLASNQKSFWWHIPAAVSGNECRIIVSDTSGAIADTTGLFTIVEAGSVDSKEMVANGGFLDSTEWRLSVNSPARASGTLLNDEYAISIDTVGEKAWQVKLEQSGFTLENGTMYRFSFDAYASHDRGIFANVGSDNGNPAWSVYGGDTIPVAITKTKTRYNQTIIMKYPTSGNIRIEFNCGNDTGKVFIDNVSLIKLESANVYVFSPSLGSTLKSEARFNIEWHAGEITTIDLDFSSDSGATWKPIFEGIDNLGIVSWTVPAVSSEKCFIRIKRADNDSVIGESSLFVINAFGTPVKTGELMVNGSFVNELKGWNTTLNNAMGQAATTDQTFRMDISQPGNDFEAIILSQSGIPVLKDKEYTFSFDAFANGTRFMGIAIIAENDSSKMLDTIIALPSVEKRSTFKFTAEKDAIVRIEFYIGGSRAAVFIDDVSFFTGVISAAKSSLAALRKGTARFAAVQQGGSVSFINCGSADGIIAVYNLQGSLVCKMNFTGDRVVWNGLLRSGAAAKGTYVAALKTIASRQTCKFMLR